MFCFMTSDFALEQFSIPGVKQRERSANNLPLFGVEVKEREELKLYPILWAFIACSRTKLTFYSF